MDGASDPVGQTVLRETVAWRGDTGRALAELRQGLAERNLAAVIIFATPNADLDALTAGLAETWPDALIHGCTTAGEIGKGGYIEDSIVAIGLPEADFCVAPVLIEDLSRIDAGAVSRSVLHARNSTRTTRPELENEFAMLLVDGLAMKEDQLVNALNPGLGSVPLFGGSAGDALRFQHTCISVAGQSHTNAAVLLLVRTRCRVHVFRYDNFEATDIRMVVTSADTEARLVHEINGEVAAREYARLVGKNPDALSPFIFAAHPVVVRVGGQFHVRAIQKVEASGHLKFFSAIDEGLVLTVAQGLSMTEHLRGALAELHEPGVPEAIIGCDCILRRLDAEQSQQSHAISKLLEGAGVVGFSTYGEQFNGLHVNQTFSGVAIYPPDGRA